MVTIRWALIILCAAAVLNAQNQKIESKQKELNDLRRQINKLETELHSARTKEKKTSGLLEKYNRQTHLLNSLINKLKVEEDQQSLLIENNQNRFEALIYQRNFLRKFFAEYYTASYKKLDTGSLAFLFDPQKGYKDALNKYYLKALAAKGRGDLAIIDSNRRQVIELQQTLEEAKKEKTDIIAQKTKEEGYLKNQLLEKRKLLTKLQKDQTSIAQEIQNKKKAEQKIHALIAQLIERARLKALAAERAKEERPKKTSQPRETQAKNSQETYNPPLSTHLQGKLLSPVKSGSIVRAYGQNKNEKLNTISVNYGIDIKTTSDHSVRCASDGEVSAIDWIPGYGTVVIISHQGELRTVYGRISSVNVREGQKVKSGTVLGEISESLEGSILHFEVWNGRHAQNPQNWIGRF